MRRGNDSTYCSFIHEPFVQYGNDEIIIYAYMRLFSETIPMREQTNLKSL